MCLLVVGTLAQQQLGLYQSEKIFFSSFIIWWGPVPVPGMAATLGLLTICLVTKILLKSPWQRRHAGIIIAHMGALLLLMGGLFTALSSEDGFMVLNAGETKQTVSDYHQRELVIRKNNVPLLRRTFDNLHEGQTLQPEGLPFTLQLTMLCRHCHHASARYVNANSRGLAGHLSLSPAPLLANDEENQSGVAFSVLGADAQQDGDYISFEQAIVQPELSVGADRYQITMEKVERPLPFSVRLVSFEKQTYPGTQTAREYQSIITLRDGDVQWDAAVRMNEPLRYKGYTVYQASFIDKNGEQRSVLTIGKNAGRVFPYVASVMMCVGLLLHVVLKMPGRATGAKQ
jgi:hypothetical protein